MPVISTFKTDNSISSGVQGTSISQAGEQAMSRAVASLGSGIADVGKAIEFQDEKKATTAANSSAIRTKGKVAELRNQLEQKHRGTEGLGKEQEFEDGLNFIMAEEQDQLPDDRARSKYGEKIRGYTDGQMLSVKISAREQGYKFRDKEHAEVTQAALDGVGNVPTVENANEVYRDLVESTLEAKNGVLAPEVADARLKQIPVKIRDNLMGGLESQGTAVAAAQMKDLLDSNLPYMKGMSGTERRKYMTRANALEKRAERDELNKLLNSAGSVVNTLEAGGDADTDGMINAVKVSSIDEEKKQALITEIQVAGAKKELIPEMAIMGMSGEEIEREAEALTEGLTGYKKDEAKAILAKGLKAKAAKLQDEKMKDPSTFFNKYSKPTRDLGLKAANTGNPEDYRAYRASIETLYDHHGTQRSQREFTPPSMKKTWGEPLSEAIKTGDKRAATGIIEKVRGMAGKDTYQVLKGMGLSDEQQAVLEFGNTDSGVMTQYLDNISASKAINDAYKQVDGDVLEDTEIARDLRGTEFFRSLSARDGNSSQNRNAVSHMLKHTSLEYKRRRADGQDHGDALEDSLKAIEKGFHKVQGGNTHPVYIDNKVHDREAHEAFLSTQVGLHQDGIDIVSKYNIDTAGLSKETWDNLDYSWEPSGENYRLVSETYRVGRKVDGKIKHIVVSFDEVNRGSDDFVSTSTIIQDKVNANTAKFRETLRKQHSEDSIRLMESLEKRKAERGN